MAERRGDSVAVGHVSVADEMVGSFVPWDGIGDLAGDSLRRGIGRHAKRYQAATLVPKPNPPTAIIAGGVGMLRGVLRAVKISNLKIPHDISVIGSTDSDLSELMVPAVTVVQVDYHSIGVESAQLLLDRLNNKVQRGAHIIKFGASLIIRESCAPPCADRS
jgi:LacI family transcriptional regulator